MAARKTDYPALLHVGWHDLTLVELRKLCVNSFPMSVTRGGIMNGLEYVLGELARVGVSAEVWIDGSFVTQKINPEDADIVLKIDAAVYDGGTDEQRRVIDWVGDNLKASHHCDSYVFYEYPDTDPNRDLGEWMRAYWIRQFGFDRSDNCKGLARLRI
jgi:hypothetical protein